MVVCSKCGFNLEGNESECPRCGVITAKARPSLSRPFAGAEPSPTAALPRTTTGTEPSVKARRKDTKNPRQDGAAITNLEEGTTQARRSTLVPTGLLLILASTVLPRFVFRLADSAQPYGLRLALAILGDFLLICLFIGIGALLIGALRNRRWKTEATRLASVTAGRSSVKRWATRREFLMRILRWILLLPGAAVSGVLVAVVLVSLVGFLLQIDPGNPPPLVAAVIMALSALAFLLVARLIAPRYQSWVVLSLAGLLVLLNILELSPAIPASRLPGALPKESVRIAEACGFIAVALAFGARELFVLRGRLAAHQRTETAKGAVSAAHRQQR